MQWEKCEKELRYRFQLFHFRFNSFSSGKKAMKYFSRSIKNRSNEDIRSSDAKINACK